MTIDDIGTRLGVTDLVIGIHVNAGLMEKYNIHSYVQVNSESSNFCLSLHH